MCFFVSIEKAKTVACDSLEVRVRFGAEHEGRDLSALRTVKKKGR